MAVSTSGRSEWRGFWFLPVSAALGMAMSVIHVYSMGPFIEPLQGAFGWSRAQVTSGLAISAMISSAFCIPVGMLVDRVGPRRVALVGMALITAGYALLGTATGTTANWVLLWVLLAFGTLGVQTTVWTCAVASRFERSRGLALAVTLSGASLAATIFPLLATALITAFGWRVAFTAQGLMWALLVYPVVFFFFHSAKDDLRTSRVAQAGPVDVQVGVSFSEGLRMPALYKLLLSSGLITFTAVGALVHFVPILTDGGAAPINAAATASLIGIFSIVGRLGTGFLLDRMPAHLIGAAACLLPIIASALLLLDGANPVSQVFAAIALGLTLGSEVDVVAYLASRHFGLRNFGALYGALVTALGTGTALGPLAAGAAFDRFGGYSEFLVLTAVLMLVSAISLASLGRPPAPAAGQHGH
jgi:MFS family permease